MKNLKEIVDYYDGILDRYHLEFCYVYSRDADFKESKKNQCVIIVDTQQEPEHKEMSFLGSKAFTLVEEMSGKYSIFNSSGLSIQELKLLFCEYLCSDNIVSSWFDKRYNKFVMDNKII